MLIAHDSGPAGAGASCVGAPSRTTMSPGCRSAAQSLAQLRNAGAQLRCRSRTAHIRTEVRSPFSDQRMNGTRGLDIERKAGSPDPFGRFDSVAGAIPRNRIALLLCPAASRMVFRNSSVASTHPHAPRSGRPDRATKQFATVRCATAPSVSASRCCRVARPERARQALPARPVARRAARH